MFHLFGIDRLQKLNPVGVFSDNTNSAGEMAVRQVLDNTKLVNDTVVNTNVGVSSINVDIFTVPANMILECYAISAMWTSGGTVTVIGTRLLIGADVFVLNNLAVATINVSVVFSGRLFIPAGGIVRAFYTVTGANANMRSGCHGVLHPVP